jgi:hypothetical protein
MIYTTLSFHFLSHFVNVVLIDQQLDFIFYFFLKKEIIQWLIDSVSQ